MQSFQYMYMYSPIKNALIMPNKAYDLSEIEFLCTQPIADSRESASCGCIHSHTTM